MLKITKNKPKQLTIQSCVKSTAAMCVFASKWRYRNQEKNTHNSNLYAKENERKHIFYNVFTMVVVWCANQCQYGCSVLLSIVCFTLRFFFWFFFRLTLCTMADWCIDLQVEKIKTEPFWVLELSKPRLKLLNWYLVKNRFEQHTENRWCLLHDIHTQHKEKSLAIRMYKHGLGLT